MEYHGGILPYYWFYEAAPPYSLKRGAIFEIATNRLNNCTLFVLRPYWLNLTGSKVILRWSFFFAICDAHPYTQESYFARPNFKLTALSLRDLSVLMVFIFFLIAVTDLVASQSISVFIVFISN